jgi:hypothetical protein
MKFFASRRRLEYLGVGEGWQEPEALERFAGSERTALRRHPVVDMDY